MYVDLHGDTRLKLNLHMHTTLSDGLKTPEEAALIYKNAGYDGVAFTDHWHYGEGGVCAGLNILSGCEYNIGGIDCSRPLFHIVAVGAEFDPGLEKGQGDTQYIIDAINDAGGAAILAHPAWSLNGDSDIMKLRGLAGIEIFNTVSGVAPNIRPYSGAVVDICAAKGFTLPLVAADDTHWYTGESCVSSVMAACDSFDREKIVGAIKSGDFYATQGPELLAYAEGSRLVIEASPVETIMVYSNLAWDRNRVIKGNAEDADEYFYDIPAACNFLRVEAVDKNGRVAWSQMIRP